MSNKIKRYLGAWLVSTFMGVVDADTMDHYMRIASDIPKMEVKADGQAQVWAKSARNILVLTCESIAESLGIANQVAAKQGDPLFCLPNSVAMNGEMLHDLIQQTYREMSSRESDKSKMTVSQVALLGLAKTYPCAPKNKSQTLRIKHVRGLY
jgi:hypothetical protein